MLFPLPFIKNNTQLLTMKVNINDKEIELKYTFRSMIIYEKITGETFSHKGVTEILVYFYSTLLASYKDLELSFEDFISWLDDNPNVINDFSSWLSSILTRNQFITEPEISDENYKKN